MKEIKMTVNGKTATFQITYACKEYVFCECNENPTLRGFFTTEFLINYAV